CSVLQSDIIQSCTVFSSLREVIFIRCSFNCVFSLHMAPAWHVIIVPRGESRGGLTIWKLGHCPRARGQ
ncbi:unnamed protein product, partial [Staurois parvus]